DVIALLAAHELAAGGREAVDLAYLLGLFRQDWGLYYTAKKNLALVREHVGRYDSLPAAARDTAGTRVRALEERIEAEPKALRWRARAAVGTRVPWYQEVRDVEER